MDFLQSRCLALIVHAEVWYLTSPEILCRDSASGENSLKISSLGFLATLLRTFSLPRWQQGKMRDLAHSVLGAGVDDRFQRWDLAFHAFNTEALGIGKLG